MNLLKPLFISKVRVKLLEILWLNPGEKYYVRELVRLTGEEINAVRRELNHLNRHHLVEREKRSNRVYFWCNRQHALFEPILNMVAKTAGLGQQIIKHRNKLGRLQIVMFNTKFLLNQTSDEGEIDILFVGQVILPEINALIKSYENQLGREINYTVFDREEFNFRKSRNDPFLSKLLMVPRTMIIGKQTDLVK